MNLTSPPDRLLALLPLWAAWMRSETVGRGYPTRSAFLCSGGSAGDDAFAELCSTADQVAVRTLDALIDDLPAICRAAIHQRWCSAVWRFRAQMYEQALAEAYERLSQGLRRWGMG